MLDTVLGGQDGLFSGLFVGERADVVDLGVSPGSVLPVDVICDPVT
jgi:hypothetical protein